MKLYVTQIVAISFLLVIGGCSAYSTKPETIHLQTSNQDIDVVLHRSDVRFTDCATLAVIQTYNRDGLIDSKEARGEALHCKLLQAGIEAGGRVGASAVLRPAKTTISNSNQQGQVQGQGQGQQQQQGQGQDTTINPILNPIDPPPSGGGEGTHGNNGGGNGSGDGTNPGTGHHSDNGDNS